MATFIIVQIYYFRLIHFNQKVKKKKKTPVPA